MSKLLLLIHSILLSGCMSIQSFSIDQTRYQATGKSHRIQFIVLHYTAEDNATSIQKLTTERVSSHYLILSGSDHKIYQLVPDHEKAWHAGMSSFRGKNFLNDISIGIEIVNTGILPQYQRDQGYHQYTHYQDYEAQQIEKIAQLLKQLIKKYDIPPRNIVGHSDIAPTRKIDPGAKFPWQLLYEKYQIGAWYNEEDKQLFMNQQEFESATIPEIKREFKRYGYDINETDEWDAASRAVIYAFQLHFNAKHATAKMDLETYAILKALNKKYTH